MTHLRSRLEIRVALAILVLASCKDEESPPTGNPDAAVDAPASAIDAPASVIDGPTTDAPAGAACTGAPYDPCTVNTECLSNNCRLFGGANLQVCTQTCNAGMPCPTQDGQAVPCNNMGICRPAVANTCTRP